MSNRERNDAGQFTERVTLEAVLGVFDQVRGPVVTSSDVADALDCTTEAARQKLTRLYDQGRVDRRKTGRTTVWWRTGDEPARTEDPADDSDAESERERGVTPSEGTDDGTDTAAGTSTHTTREAPAPLSLDTADFPDSRDREDCLAAVDAARAYLREHGSATMRDLVMNVMPAHPVGYSVDDAREKLAAGDRYRGGWWRLVVRPGLEALDDVEKPPRGGSDWEYVGGDDQDTADPLDESGPYDPTGEWGGT